MLRGAGYLRKVVTELNESQQRGLVVVRADGEGEWDCEGKERERRPPLSRDGDGAARDGGGIGILRVTRITVRNNGNPTVVR